MPLQTNTAQSVRAAVVLAALGVVFGDIGTSPIYTVQTVFNPRDPHPVPLNTDNVYGIVSLIFWSVMLIVTLTYVTLVMRADNDGEGGIMALITLLRRWGLARGRRTALMLAALGVFGAALFFGDSMITPAISVLSAIEGIEVVDPGFEEMGRADHGGRSSSRYSPFSDTEPLPSDGSSVRSWSRGSSPSAHAESTASPGTRKS